VTVDGARGGPVFTFGGKPVQPGTSIPVTGIRVPLLIGDGGQDGVWATAASATLITHELAASARLLACPRPTEIPQVRGGGGVPHRFPHVQNGIPRHRSAHLLTWLYKPVTSLYADKAGQQ
jgi:hypothetical protein